MQNTEAQNTQNTRRGIVTTETTTAPAMEAHFRAVFGDTTQQAREAFGEDSVTIIESSTTYVATNAATGEVTASGSFEATTETTVGAEHTRSQTTALPIAAIMHELGNINTPQARVAIETAIAVAIMRRDGASAEECAAHYAANGVAWSEDTERRNDFLARIRAESIRTVRAPVRTRVV